MDDLGRGRGWALPPELVDDAVDRDDLVSVQEEEREESALTPAAERERLASLIDRLERPKEPELRHKEPKLAPIEAVS
jgi:hypothetical protein